MNEDASEKFIPSKYEITDLQTFTGEMAIDFLESYCKTCMGHRRCEQEAGMNYVKVDRPAVWDSDVITIVSKKDDPEDIKITCQWYSLIQMVR